MIDVAHHRHHRWASDFNLTHVLILHQVFEGLVGHLIFEGDDLGVGSKLGSHILNQFGIEGLIDGDKNAAHQKRCDEVLTAYTQFFGQVLYANAFCHRDGTGDGHRLRRDLRSAETRRRGEALHWAFLGLGILLASATLLRSCALRPWSFAWRWSQATCATGSRARGAKAGPSAKAGARSTKTRPSAGTGSSAGLGPCGVHGATSASRSILSWPGTVTGSSRRRATTWAASIEDWPSTLNGTSRRRGSTGAWSGNLSDRWRRRGCVDRARAGLRHDDAPDHRWWRSLSGHWFHNGTSRRTAGR